MFDSACGLEKKLDSSYLRTIDLITFCDSDVAVEEIEEAKLCGGWKGKLFRPGWQTLLRL